MLTVEGENKRRSVKAVLLQRNVAKRNLHSLGGKMSEVLRIVPLEEHNSRGFSVAGDS